MITFIDNMDFTVLAVLSASLISLMTSYIGIYVILRRITFVGASLAQLAAAGTALSGLLEIPCSLGAAAAMAAGVCFFAGQDGNQRRLPADGIIGTAYAAAGALTVILIAVAPHADSDMLGLMFGNILAASAQDILLMASLLLITGTLNIVFHRQFLLTAFDPMMAHALGYNVKFWNWLFYIILGTSIAAAIHTAGVLLVFSMLVIPPLTGLTLSRRWNLTAAVSAVSSLAAVFGGVFLSIRRDLPTGASIIFVSFCIFLAALGYKKIVQTIKKA